MREPGYSGIVMWITTYFRYIHCGLDLQVRIKPQLWNVNGYVIGDADVMANILGFRFASDFENESESWPDIKTTDW